MESEIELKLLVSADAGKVLKKRFVPHLNVKFLQQTTQLFNSYYDTEEEVLRQHEMGLRIRGENGQYEQTLKSKNGSVGGLHQRHEINIDLPNNEIALALFPDEIWPKDLDPVSLQHELKTVFSTHFQRTQYLFDVDDGSRVELVFDQGEIENEKFQEEICEIEMELKRGNPANLFSLARELAEFLPFRLGYKSKAQRGYELCAGDLEAGPEQRLPLPINKSGTVEDAFTALIGHGISCWQFHEEQYAKVKKARNLIGVYNAISLIKRCFILFASQIKAPQIEALSSRLEHLESRWAFAQDVAAIKELASKRGLYRKKLSKNNTLLQELLVRQEALINDNQPEQLIGSKEYVTLQLDLIELVSLKLWPGNDSQNLINKFAKKALKQELQKINLAFSFEGKGNSESYLEQLPEFNGTLHVYQLLSNVVSSKTANNVQTWIDILEGIEELRVLGILEKQLKTLVSDGKDKLVNWCVEKQSSLLEIIELSRESAIHGAVE